MNVKKDILTINFTPNGMKEIRGLVIHSMWGTYQGSITWFKNPDAKASAHYLISAEGEITQMVEDKDMAWHAGIIDDVAPEWVRPNPNWYTLGIELEDKRDVNWSYPEPQRFAARELVKSLMNKYSLPSERVLLHKWLNPSRRSDPVGQFSFEWLIPSAPPTNEDQERAVKLISQFKEAHKYGNLEGATRALLDTYAHADLIQSELDELKKTFDTRLKQAVEQARAEEVLNWQNKLTTANNRIKELEQTISEGQTKKLEEYDWQVLLAQALKNFFTKQEVS